MQPSSVTLPCLHQPYHQFPEFGMSGTPRLCWIGPKTVIKPLAAKPQNGFPPIARSLYHQHSMQTCIDGRCFHKDAKLPCPTVWGWEWHGRTKVWVPCLDELPDTSFAGALWMYSCVQGKLHVAPCCDLTKHLLQMWMWLHKQWYRQLTFTKTSELSRCNHAAQ